MIALMYFALTRFIDLNSLSFSRHVGVENESRTDFAIILFTGVIIFGLFFGHFAEIVSYAPKLFIYKTNSVPIGFSEVMGLPDSQINTTCRLHWYNNVVLDTQQIGRASCRESVKMR